MSIHAHLSAEAEDRIRAQKRTSTVSSILISLLVVVLIALILFLVALPGFFVETKTIVAYSAPSEDEEVITKKTVNTQVQRNPSAPSSAMAKVIASSAPSPTAVPVPDVVVTEPSMEFGSGDDFGDGWDSGNGTGSGFGGPGFFGTTSRGDRFCYVIDYSASMNGQRDKLMRAELEKSIKEIPDGAKYQLIFFAGPAWVAGSEIQNKGAKTNSVIKGTDGKKYEWRSKGGAHNWEPIGKKQVPKWIDANSFAINKSKKIVRETKLVWGTQWSHPLEMALSMEPPPQVIYFMTDGSAGPNSKDTAKSIGSAAKRKGITINCIAMMDPKARDAMGDLAKRTGGQFTMVKEGGKVEKIKVK